MFTTFSHNNYVFYNNTYILSNDYHKYFKTYYTKWPAGGRNAYKFQLEEIENNETTWEEVIEYLYKDNPIVNKDYLINWFKDRYEIPVKR